MQSESATVYLIDPLLLIANSWSSSYEAVEHQLNKIIARGTIIARGYKT
jgi:hypothetical protein